MLATPIEAINPQGKGFLNTSHFPEMALHRVVNAAIA
jgi:hypothetical protein